MSVNSGEPSAMTASPPSLGTGGYSRENAERFGWSSVSGTLNPERVSHLEKYLAGQTVLDAGCGGGAFVDFLTRRGLEVTGVDLYATFLGIGQERGYQGHFVQGDVTALPFTDKQFDSAYCFDVLEHVDDHAAVRELARVTRTRILLAVPRQEHEFAPYNLTFRHYQDTTHLRYYTEDSLRALTEIVHPQSVQVFPELNVSVSEMVRTLTTLDEQALRKRIEGLLAPIVAVVETASQDTSTRDSVLDTLEVTPYTGQGVTDSLRTRAVADLGIQQHFKDEYRATADAVMSHYVALSATLARQGVNEAVNALTDQIVRTILFEASYPTIPTGLVAVIDL